MKCPRCNNTKTFRHYAIAETEALIYYDKDGEAEDRDPGEDEIIGGTTMMQCAKCSFLCLPEVFGNTGPKGWPKPYQDGNNRWYFAQGTELNFYGFTVKGKEYLNDKVGESYSQLFQIHMCGSLAGLPQFLASDLPEIKNSAIEKMEELQC